MSNAADTRRPVADGDLVFYLQIYQDAALTKAALKRLRKHYPSSRVILISDGDKDPAYPKLAARFAAEYIEGERLYLVGCGGQMHQRMLEAFMQKPAKFLVKMDTDTRIDRRLAFLPEGHFLFGHEEASGCLQGGCIFFPYSACKALIDSKLFLSEELKDWKNSWGKMGSEKDWALCAARVSRLGLISFERVLLWACLRLQIRNAPFTEVWSEWMTGNANKDLKYAIVHPDKWMHLPGVIRWFRTFLARFR